MYTVSFYGFMGLGVYIGIKTVIASQDWSRYIYTKMSNEHSVLDKVSLRSLECVLKLDKVFFQSFACYCIKHDTLCKTEVP